MRIKNKTYRTMMYVINRLERDKGYPLDEAKEIAEALFKSFDPNGISMDAKIDMVITKAEWDALKQEEIEE